MLHRKIKKVFPVIAAVLLLACAIGASFMKNNGTLVVQAGNLFTPGGMESSANASNTAQSGSASAAPQPIRNADEEMRAVWVPFMTLDCKDTDRTEQAFQAKFNNIIAVAKDRGMNTLIVHVRAYGDAMYPSQYFPWSHLLTGTQGQDPGYDPLAYMISAAHQAGMQLHAWINPLRIQVIGTPGVLAGSNPYEQWRNDGTAENDSWVLDWGSDKYYNPASPQARAQIIEGVTEIVKNYDVDGIHFDDYFYPTTDASYDQVSYDAYCAQMGQDGKPLTLADWRKTNINTLVSGVYSAVHAAKPNVVFGISPQGNISNCVSMGADVTSWGNFKGYVDYLCPQIYVNFDHPLLPFDKTAQTWRDLVTCPAVKLYFGLGVYKAGSDADNGTWKTENDILMKQITYGREVGCDGFMLYSWEYLNNAQTEQEIQNVMKVLN